MLQKDKFTITFQSIWDQQCMDCAETVLSNILPDSTVAKISCGKTKVSSITECVSAKKAQEVVLKHLQAI